MRSETAPALPSGETLERLREAVRVFDEWAAARDGSRFGTVVPLTTNCAPLIELLDAAREAALAAVAPEPSESLSHAPSVANPARVKCAYVVVLEVNEHQQPYTDEIWCAIQNEPWKQRTEVVSVTECKIPAQEPDARFRDYVQHKLNCDVAKGLVRLNGECRCNCGLAALLAPGEKSCS